MSLFRLTSHTRHTLLRDFRGAGIVAGDVVIVHSAMKNIGWISGGVQEFVRALQEAVGPGGTLVMPTFTFSLAGWECPPFDPARTESHVGLLTDTFWRMGDVLRSVHPTHSVAAWGRLAAEIIGGEINYEPLGRGSPYDCARDLGAKILLAGVHQNKNSMIHVAEARAAMPYLRVPFTIDSNFDEAWYIEPRVREPRFLAIYEMPGSSEGFDVLDDLLLERGIAKRVAVGDAVSSIMDAQAVCAFVENLLCENPVIFLEHSNPSDISKRRRAAMECRIAKAVT